MKKRDKVFFIHKKQVMSSKVTQVINDLVGVVHPEDEERILYVDKDWVFKTQREAERRLKKYGWDK